MKVQSPALSLSRRAATRFALSCALIVLFTSPAQAFFSYNEQWAGANMEGWKWGNPLRGTGAVITWGFMTDTTVPGPDFIMAAGEPGPGIIGTSNITGLRATFDGVNGTGAFDTAIQNAFNTWSAAANISFVGPLPDTGLPINDPGAHAPMIRIGAFSADPTHSFNNGFAAGFIPPPNGGSLEGDIIFNIDKALQIAPGIEDVDPIQFWLGNDLESLFVHELGHGAIGLGHPSWDGEDPDLRVMYVGDFTNPSAPFCCTAINRQLHPDDIAGAVFNYGPAGDYNNSGSPDAADIDALMAERNAGTHDPYYEQTFDGLVTQADVDFWVTDPSIANTFFGDTNLDHTVNPTDLATLTLNWLGAGGWALGDFSGDGVINPTDLASLTLNWLNTNPTTPATVPEPHTLALLAVAAAPLPRRRGRQPQKNPPCFTTSRPITPRISNANPAGSNSIATPNPRPRNSALDRQLRHLGRIIRPDPAHRVALATRRTRLAALLRGHLLHHHQPRLTLVL